MEAAGGGGGSNQRHERVAAEVVNPIEEGAGDTRFVQGSDQPTDSPDVSRLRDQWKGGESGRRRATVIKNRNRLQRVVLEKKNGGGDSKQCLPHALSCKEAWEILGRRYERTLGRLCKRNERLGLDLDILRPKRLKARKTGKKRDEERFLEKDRTTRKKRRTVATDTIKPKKQGYVSAWS